MHWASFYKEKDLHVYAIQPSLVSPTHYTGEPNHVSDTEQTKVLNDVLLQVPPAETNTFGTGIEQSENNNVHFEL